MALGLGRYEGTVRGPVPGLGNSSVDAEIIKEDMMMG